MNRLFKRLLEVRNLDESFLNPKYENLTDPFLLTGMKEAIERIKKAKNEDEKVLIYGDYDVDGITASTLMEDALKLAGIKPENISIMLPDRFTDGYGMSPRLIKRAKAKKVNLVLTVDCGSRNHDIINELSTLSIDCVVTDHHETEDVLPEALAVINPKRKDTNEPENLRNLAGVGVAFKLAEGLVRENLIKAGQEKWLLDLVLLGTICDNMTLVKENRILGYFGFKVLSKTRRAGLREIMKLARVKNLNSDAVGFQIGPRLNAAGRLETAELSLNLLREESSAKAASLAENLEELNKKRKNEQLSMVKEIEQRGVSDEPVIIETGSWHEGILGIVAGRLVEKYKKPAFVLTETENHIFKGSGRSFGDFNLADALESVKDTIISGGGHAGAAGVRVSSEKMYEFRERINDYYHSLNLVDQERFLNVEPDLDIEDFSELSLEFLEDLKKLEPFGAGNEEPVFRLKNANISSLTRMGAEKNHLRLDIRDRFGHSLKLVSFYAPEKWFNLDPDALIEPLIKVSLNDYNGIKSVEGRLVDI